MFETSDEPKGIGGWLFFLCLILTILAPAVTLISMVVGLSDGLRFMGVVPGWTGFLVTDTVLSLAVVAFSMTAGIALWRTRPNGARLATAALGVIILYNLAALVMTKLFPLPNEVESEMLKELTPSSLRGVVVSLIWLVYLKKSRRVRNTFQVAPNNPG